MDEAGHAYHAALLKVLDALHKVTAAALEGPPAKKAKVLDTPPSVHTPEPRVRQLQFASPMVAGKFPPSPRTLAFSPPSALKRSPEDGPAQKKAKAVAVDAPQARP